jgi:hypothetical protein
MRVLFSSLFSIFSSQFSFSIFTPASLGRYLFDKAKMWESYLEKRGGGGQKKYFTIFFGLHKTALKAYQTKLKHIKKVKVDQIELNLIDFNHKRVHNRYCFLCVINILQS